MAANDWPISLPQSVLLNGLQLTAPTGAVRTQMSAGEPYQRQRFTAAWEPFIARMHMTHAQYTTLRGFWKDVLGHGALPFNWRHPITLEDAEVRFNIDEPFTVVGRSGDTYTISVSMEVLV